MVEMSACAANKEDWNSAFFSSAAFISEVAVAAARVQRCSQEVSRAIMATSRSDTRSCSAAPCIHAKDRQQIRD